MASWTNLNTVFTPYTQVSLSMWNELSGFEGNLQYLYEVLNKYGFQDYYAYGFYNADNLTSFTMTSWLTYDLETSERIDERPTEIEAQFFDTANFGNIQIRKTGLYLLNAHALPINAVNNDNKAGFSLKFARNNVDISETLTTESNSQSTLNRRLDTPNPLNYFAIQSLSEDDVINPNILTYGSGDAELYQYTGSWLNNKRPFAKSPYVSSLFLTSEEYFKGTEVIYFFQASKKYFPAINNEYFAKITLLIKSPGPGVLNANEAPWASINKPTEIIAYGANYFDPNFFWSIGYDSPAISYSIPAEYDSNGNPNQNPLWKIINATTNTIPIEYRYFLFAFKALDYYNEPYYETNIISFCIYDQKWGSDNEGLKSVVCTLSVSWDASANAIFWLRTYWSVKKVVVAGLNPTDKILVGLSFAQLYNSNIIYQPSIIINNQVVAFDIVDESNLIYEPDDGYDLSEFFSTPTRVYTNDITQVNANIIQGENFATCSSSFVSSAWSYAPKRASAAAYAKGNWKISDEFLNATTATTEKLYIWQQMIDTYNIPDTMYTCTSFSMTVPGMIVIGTYNFDDTGRLL